MEMVNGIDSRGTSSAGADCEPPKEPANESRPVSSAGVSASSRSPTSTSSCASAANTPAGEGDDESMHPPASGIAFLRSRLHGQRSSLNHSWPTPHGPFEAGLNTPTPLLGGFKGGLGGGGGGQGVPCLPGPLLSPPAKPPPLPLTTLKPPPKDPPPPKAPPPPISIVDPTLITGACRAPVPKPNLT